MVNELIQTDDAFQRMDAMYRHQRYFYDATRKFYLLGRDRMIDQLAVRNGDIVVEIGCGTGRNLEKLARRTPSAKFFGIDASSQMLETAVTKLESAGIDNVQFRCELAENFSPSRSLGIGTDVDTIFFSYAITMIPEWRSAIRAALDGLKPGGQLIIVDFYDQAELPSIFRSLLKAWLRQFDVRFWRELMPFLETLEKDGEVSLEVESVAKRYAFIATMRKRAKV